MAAVPQAVLSPLTRAALIIVVTVESGGEARVREFLPDLSGLQRAIGFRAPDGDLSCVTGIGSRIWDRLLGGPRPAELHPFRELAGPVHRAIRTPGDLLFHIRAQRTDLCFALGGEIMDRLRDVVAVRDEMPFGAVGRGSSARTSSATRRPPASPSGCWSGCSSETAPHRTTASSTSRPR